MCGVVGVIGSPASSLEVYQGLLSIQHRGQDAAGILSYNFNEQRFHLTKNKGLITDIFKQDEINNLIGEMSIGHTRYATVGRGEISDVLPLRIGHPLGMGIVHNGNVLNYYQLRKQLQEEHSCHFLTYNDVEIIQNVIVDNLNKREAFSFSSLCKAVESVFENVIGGYVVIGCVAEEGFYAFRDPKGIRPMVLGEKELTEEEIEKNGGNYRAKKAYCLASESAVFFKLGYKLVRDIRPGEVIFIDREGDVQSKILKTDNRCPCMFEWVYFSTPESVIDNKSVYQARLNLGNGLAKQIRPMVEKGVIQPEVVTTVPETSRLAALSLAEELGLPYREVLIKNRYIHRSFILKEQKQRERAVDMKLSPVVNIVEGKNVLVVDDSIVRGTTSKRIINLLRKAGAKKVYLASTCPPLLHPCFYGIDFPSSSELVAFNKNVTDIEQELNADKVIYIEPKELVRAIGVDTICDACLSGTYPTDIRAADEFQKKRKQDKYRATRT
jgi:amidophosphoribosyltransferase